jgi:hypothetical protein
MASQQSISKEYHKQEKLTVWFDNRGANAANLKTSELFIDNDKLDISAEAKQMMVSNQDETLEMDMELAEPDKQKIMVLEKMLSALTGKKIKFVLPQKIKIDNNRLEGSLQKMLSRELAAPGMPVQRVGWGLEYSRRETYQESESMSFKAAGIIKTVDGREIKIEVEMNLSRRFLQESNINILAGDAQLADPLVINYGGKAAELTTDKFSFDLDTDGQAEQISFVSPGSGFLALDLNGDNRINNGAELFGPASGDGFAELAVYDADGNGWIDENDPIYNQLRIWSKDAEGKDNLLALGQVGVGAIYLGNIDAGFNFKNEENELLGVARKAGIFIRENGTAGTVQQIDLAV